MCGVDLVLILSWVEHGRSRGRARISNSVTNSSHRQDYDDANDFDRPVQAFRYRESGPKNETESARTICSWLGWRFNAEDQVTEDRGPVIGLTIEDIAAAWLMQDGSSQLGPDPAGLHTGVRSRTGPKGWTPTRQPRESDSFCEMASM